MQTLSKLLTYEIATVAFVDCIDSATEITLPYWDAELSGFRVLHIPRELSTLDEIVSYIEAHADAAVCAHRLDYPNLCGAELAAALYDRGIPALLVTQYLDIDQHSSIRFWRSRLPRVMHLRHVDAETLAAGLKFCVAELQGRIAEERMPYRVMVGVEHVEGVVGPQGEVDQQFVDVSVDYWDHYQRVRLPMTLIPAELRHAVRPQAWFFAQVNIYAERSADLYFRDFALAPPPLFEENLTYCINVLDDVNFCELPLLWFVEQYWRTEEIFDVRRCATHKEQLN
jgi:hypothetical protein